MSEDCLTLNIFAPQAPAGRKLPVMVWIHGGGFQAGGGAEPRHDGQAFARKGVVLVTINYRLGVFGFLAHPDLTRESDRRASGNYGMLDQVAALRWVNENIAAFGGDPANVTIFGESAGSVRGERPHRIPAREGALPQGHRRERGVIFSGGGGTLALAALADAEQVGAKFAASAGADSIAALRAKPAEVVLDLAQKTRQFFAPIVDGVFLPADVASIYAAGTHNQVPLLAGWNADEMRAAVTLRPQKPTAQSFADDARKRFGASADAILKAYPAATDAEALESAAALGSPGFREQFVTPAKVGNGPWVGYYDERLACCELSKGLSMLSHRRGRGGRGDSGAAAVEFAIVVPVLLLLLMGMLEFAFVMRDYLSVASSVRVGARIASTSEGIKQGTCPGLPVVCSPANTPALARQECRRLDPAGGHCHAAGLHQSHLRVQGELIRLSGGERSDLNASRLRRMRGDRQLRGLPVEQNPRPVRL